MADYPGSLFSPSDITTGTVFEAALVTEAYDEVDAIESELGLGVHGEAGSLTNRIDMFMSKDGTFPYMRIADAADINDRKRSRHGVTAFEASDLDETTGKGTLIFAPPLSELRDDGGTIAIVTLQIVTDDIASPDEPTQACFIVGSGGPDRFDFVCLNGNGEPPSSGSFLLHWSVYERLFSDENSVDLDFGGGFELTDGRGPPGVSGLMGIEDGLQVGDATDAFLFENGDVMQYEGFDSTGPEPANFMLTEAGDTMVFEHDLPADETFQMGYD